jgi:hypothetical protein
MLHLVPAWQSSQKHVRLKTIMQDRPDLIQSELSGLAFDALQQAFRKSDLDKMTLLKPPPRQLYENIYVFIDPGKPVTASALVCVGLTPVSRGSCWRTDERLCDTFRDEVEGSCDGESF